SDHVNNLAVSPDGSWVASAGDLGLAVWSRDGKLLWSRDWWKTDRHTATLAALDADTLLAVEGMTATACTARTGRQRWQVRLALGGAAANVIVSGDGKTCAVQAREGGRIYVLREGKVVATIHGGATAKDLRHLSSTTGTSLGITGVALSADGSHVAVTSGNLLKLYSVPPPPPPPPPPGGGGGKNGPPPPRGGGGGEGGGGRGLPAGAAGRIARLFPPDRR